MTYDIHDIAKITPAVFYVPPDIGQLCNQGLKQLMSLFIFCFLVNSDNNGVRIIAIVSFPSNLIHIKSFQGYVC